VLKAFAEKLGARFDRENWGKILSSIEEKIGDSKNSEAAEVLIYLRNIKNAWRNSTNPGIDQRIAIYHRRSVSSKFSNSRAMERCPTFRPSADVSIYPSDNGPWPRSFSSAILG
jgi:hypothetical protein